MARNICRAIKEARDAAGLSQEQFADLLGVPQSTVHHWEIDREPKLDRIAEIEDALGLRRGELVRKAGYVEDAPPTTEQAIRADRSIRPGDRRALLDLLSLYRSRS